MTKLIKTTQEIKSILQSSKRSIGFVPTMGALHAGHVSLIKAARKECTTVVVSIFINPLQFGPNEDYKKYPRDLEADLKVCEENKVDIVFAPEKDEIFPGSSLDKEVILVPEGLGNILCGKTRIGHFNGVATVVYKLFNIISPDYAYFGEKDLQQLYIIKWLVNAYKLHVSIRSYPTVRELNGLACSSRNVFLSNEQKHIAASLYKSLKLAKQDTKTGIFTVSKAILESLVFLSQFPEVKVEYFEARDKARLDKVEDDKTKDFYYLACIKIGDVRLIDNIEV